MIPVSIKRREYGVADPSSPLLHPALSNSLSRSFGLSSPFSLSAMSSSLTALSGSPGRSMGMSLGRSFEERPKLEAQFFKNFSCCGLDLQDLHGLLEHFEECHVAFDESSESGLDVDMEMDDGGSEGTISGPPSPRMQPGQVPRSLYEMKKSTLSAFDSAPASPASTALHLDGGMELDMEMDDAPSHPSGSYNLAASVQHTISISTSSSATVSSSSPYPPPMSAFDSPLQSAGGSSKKKFSTAMNAHALGGNMRGIGMGMGGMMGLDALAAARAASAYSTPDSSVPGTPVMEEVPGGGVDGLFSNTISGSATSNIGLAPSLLFPGAAESPASDDGGLHDGSDSGGESKESTPLLISLGPGALSALPTSLHPLGSGVQISPSGRPYTPPSEKPFKCNVIGCDKSYKQQNGLKYHRLHGHCNQNNVGKEGHEVRGEGKPYVCHVTSCGKRYKNMNGLRYHYQHSGAHGALGLQMLAQSCHPPPQYPLGHKRAATGSASTSRAGSPTLNGNGLAPGTIINNLSHGYGDHGGRSISIVSIGGGLDLLPPIPLGETTTGLGTVGMGLPPSSMAQQLHSSHSLPPFPDGVRLG